MITVNVSKDGITLSGHAGYARHGNDIVCAGVTALTQGFIQSVEELTGSEIKYDISPGRADIDIKNPTKETKILRDSFLIGINMIADEFPENVRVVQAWNDDKSYGEKSGVETQNYGKQCESFKNRTER